MAKLLTQTVTTLLEVGQKAAETSLFPPAGVLPLQGSVVKNSSLITCKLTVSTMVAPGLYPMPKEKEYPAPYAKKDPRSIMDMLGATTYEVYTVQALTPAGDTPLQFTPYGAVAGGTSKAAAPGDPLAMSINSTAVEAKLLAYFNGDTGKYKGTVKRVSMAAGSTPAQIKLTVTLNASITAATEATEEAELVTEGTNALKSNAPPVTVESVTVTPVN